MKNKEQIYDEKISPLMAQILEICKTNHIAMIATFSIPTPEVNDLRCTSAVLEEACDPPTDLLTAFKIIKPREPRLSPVMIKTVEADGKTTLTAFTD